MDTASGALRGMGASVTAMAISIFGACVFRIAWIYTIFRIPKYHTTDTLYISYIFSWLIVFCLSLVAYSFIYKKLKRLSTRKEPIRE